MQTRDADLRFAREFGIESCLSAIEKFKNVTASCNAIREFAKIDFNDFSLIKGWMGRIRNDLVRGSSEQFGRRINSYAGRQKERRARVFFFPPLLCRYLPTLVHSNFADVLPDKTFKLLVSVRGNFSKANRLEFFRSKEEEGENLESRTINFSHYKCVALVIRSIGKNVF